MLVLDTPKRTQTDKLIEIGVSQPLPLNDSNMNWSAQTEDAKLLPPGSTAASSVDMVLHTEETEVSVAKSGNLLRYDASFNSTSFLYRLGADIVSHQLLLLLKDTDAIALLLTSKDTFHKCHPTYYIKKIMTAADLNKFYPISTSKYKFSKFSSIYINSDESLAYVRELNPPLRKLIVGNCVRNPITKDLFPTSVTQVEFLNYGNFPMTLETFPSTLKKITFGERFNRILQPNVLPTSLQVLKFGDRFNQRIEKDVLPFALVELTFQTYYDQSFDIGVLPPSLQTLSLGFYFNQPIQRKVLPPYLRSLTFGYHFNQHISPHVLPFALEHLTFGLFFNQRIFPGVLPSSLKTLTFGSKFNQKIMPGDLPKRLQKLTFGFYYDQPIGKNVLPESLIELNFDFFFNHAIATDILPPKLEYLRFGDRYNYPFYKGILPSTLLQIDLGLDFKQEKESVFPERTRIFYPTPRLSGRKRASSRSDAIAIREILAAF